MRDMSHGKNSNVSGERFRRTTTESRNPELCETVRPCWPVSCDADVVDVSLAYDIPVTGMTCCGTAAFADFWIMANRVALASVVLPLMKLSAERSFAWFNPGDSMMGPLRRTGLLLRNWRGDGTWPYSMRTRSNCASNSTKPQLIRC